MGIPSGRARSLGAGRQRRLDWSDGQSKAPRRLGKVLAQRQLANDQWTPDTASQTVEQVRSGLLGKLREFFAL